MQITFNSYDTKAELEMVRDLAGKMVDRYEEMNPHSVDSSADQPEEVDSRVDVPIAPAPPTGPHDFPAGTETIPPAPVTPRVIDDVDPAAEAAIERDKHGRVWDERIDSSNRKQTTSGEWMKRKNVDPAVRTAVIDELMAVAPAPETTFAEAQAPAPVEPLVVNAAVPAPPAAVPAPPAAAPEAPTAPEVPAGSTLEWGDVFQRTMAAQMAQKLSQEQIDSKCAEYGITTGFPGLIAHPDKWELFLAELLVD